MSKPLTDNELRDKVSRILDDVNNMGIAERGQDGWYIYFDRKVDEMLQLIQEQQAAWTCNWNNKGKTTND